MADDDGTDDTPPATFSQDDVTAAATRAAKEAERRTRQSLTQSIADELGCSVEEAKAIIAAKQATDAANATELDKARQAQAQAEAKATAAEQAAARLTAETAAKDALLAAKVRPEHIARALRLIDPGSDDLDGEITALAEDLPALFTTDDGTGTPPPPPAGFTPPRTPPAGGSTPKSMAELGHAEAVRLGWVKPPVPAA